MPNRKHVWVWRFLILALAGLLSLIFAVRQAGADAVPNPESAAADGRNVGPVELTDLQMISETVLMEVQPVSISAPEFSPLGPIDLWGASVTVDFVLYNPRPDSQSMPVGFPLFITERVDARFYSEIWNLQAFVNAVEITTTRTTISGSDWSIWPMTFPPGNTLLRVTYDVIAHQAGGLAGPVAIFGYVLRTGAAWAGPIGQGDLIVRFPYLAEPTFIDPQGTLTGYTIDGLDVKWHFENLEPTVADDLMLKVVHPEVWGDVASARQAVAADRSSENYRNLARAYASIISNYYVLAEPDDLYSFYSPLLAQTAEAQYLKAIELDPDNRELRQELTEFVMTWEGLLLPASELLVLTQIASTPIATATNLPASDDTATSPPPTRALATKAVTAIAQASTATPVSIASNTPPVSLPTATPAPPESPPLNFTPWLIGALVIVILVGLGIALRKPAK